MICAFVLIKSSALSNERIKSTNRSVGYILANQAPYGGSAFSFPGILEAENYDEGGIDVAYSDNTSGNANNSSLRNDDVDLKDVGAGNHIVGNNATGEWLEYTVDIPNGSYDFTIRYSTAQVGKQLTVKLGDGPEGTNFQTLATIDLPTTSGWNNFESFTVNDLEVTNGGSNKVLRLETTIGFYDIDWIQFESISEEYFYVQNKGTGLYLRAADLVEGSYITAATLQNSDWFKWQRVDIGNFFYLVNAASGYTFRPQNLNDAALLEQTTIDASDHATQWSFELSNDGTTSYFVNRAFGKHIRPNSANNNTPVDLRPSSWRGNFTRWSLEPAGDITPVSYTLSSSIIGSGSVDPSEGTFEEGTSVSITATPSTGYSFVNWSGDASGSANPLTLDMDDNKNITANFEIQTFTLNTQVNGNGSIYPNGGTYDYNSNVLLEAIPEDGYQFDGWSGDVSGTNPFVTVNMVENMTAIANFSEIPAQYTIVVRAREISNQAEFDLLVGGTVVGSSGPLTSTYANYEFTTSLTGNIQVYFSDSFVPNADMRVDYISVDGQIIQSESREINTSAWGTACGNNSFTELMHCEGHIDYGILGIQNNAPTVGAISSQTISLSDGPQNISLSGISDGDGCTQIVSVSSSTSNSNVATSSVNYSSCNNSGTLTLTPQGAGTTIITVIVSDNGGTLDGGIDTYQTSFSVTIEDNGPVLAPRGANVDESTIQTTIYVSPSGNNNNNGLSPTNALRTVKRGLQVAHTYLLLGNNTKLSIANGNYSWSGGSVNWNHGSNSPARDAVFIMEGQSKSGVVINGSGMTGTEMFRNEDYKRNVVMRNFTITQAKRTTFFIGAWPVVSDHSNWLIEDIDILSNATAAGNNQRVDAFILYYVQNLTVRRCRFNGNNHNGATIFCRDALILDSEFNDNMKTQRNSSNVGGLGFHGDNVLVKGCEFNDNGTLGGIKAWGFRSDWVHEYVDIEDCEMNGNSRAGIILETAKGPSTIKNCTFMGNIQGLQIATTSDITVTNCDIKNNTRAAIRFTNKYRERDVSDYPGAGSFQIPIGAGWNDVAYQTIMANNLNFTVKNCVIGTNYNHVHNIIYRKNTVDSDQDVNYYEQMVKNELNFDNNQYYHLYSNNVFDIDLSQGSNTFGNFNQWKALTGADANSTFTSSDLTNVSAFTNARFDGNDQKVISSDNAFNWSVYPNPSSGQKVLVRMNDVTKGLVQILDVQGKIVFQKGIDSKNLISIDQSLNTGIYLVKLITKLGTSSQKLMITK